MSAAAYFQQNPDVAAAYQQNTYGLTPEQFAQTHYELYGQNEQRAAPSTAAYFQQNPDVAAAYDNRFVDPNLASTVNMTPDQFAQTHYELYGQTEQRAAPTAVRPPVVQPPVVRPPVVVQPPVVRPPVVQPPAGALIPYFRQNPDVAASYAQNNYGMTPEQFAEYHFLNYGRNEQRSTPSTIPFANATQGFQQNFQNYTSIPIGAQYNPNVVGGTGSPYSQIMSQMQPVGNPYATVRSGLAMGGYDPSIYDPNLLSNFVQQRAAELAAAGMPAPLGFDGGGGDSGFGGGGGGVGGVGGAGGPGSTSAAAPSDFGAFNGGLITKVMGPNPPTPDDGTMFVQKGEYIVKKDAVNKYGKGLLDKINDGKIPAKKMKSLLG
jgi:hypothetical protein